jgi:excinuclease ABC subunit A
MDTGKEHLFSSKFACPVCNYALQELEPRLFSFNNPMGACQKCDGLGQIQFFDPARVVAYPHLSLAAGAIKGWDRRNQFYFQMLESLAAHYGIDTNVPFEALPRGDHRHRALRLGQGADQVQVPERERHALRPQPPLRGHHPQPRAPLPRDRLDGGARGTAKYLNNKPCPECGGMRLRREARHVFVGGKTISDISRLSLINCRDFFNLLQLTGQKAQVGEKILKEITARLSFLINVGLDYLSLDRSAETLSGGEAQRIRLASQIGSGLTGVMYVLDEPSIGLHQRDNDRLLETLFHLRDLGNTVIVVEHDEEAIRSGRLRGGHGPRRRRARRPRGRRRHAGRWRPTRLGDRRLPRRPARDRHPGQTHAAQRPARTEASARRSGNNLKDVDAGDSGRPAHLHHRRLRLRQSRR